MTGATRSNTTSGSMTPTVDSVDNGDDRPDGGKRLGQRRAWVVNRPFDGKPGAKCPDHRPRHHRTELRALPFQQRRVGGTGHLPPRGSEMGIDPVTDLLVDLFKERLHNGVPVLGSEFVVDFRYRTDFVRGKP